MARVRPNDVVVEALFPLATEPTPVDAYRGVLTSFYTKGEFGKFLNP
jgi:hypothetical protein